MRLTNYQPATEVAWRPDSSRNRGYPVQTPPGASCHMPDQVPAPMRLVGRLQLAVSSRPETGRGGRRDGTMRRMQRWLAGATRLAGAATLAAALLAGGLGTSTASAADCYAGSGRVVAADGPGHLRASRKPNRGRRLIPGPRGRVQRTHRIGDPGHRRRRYYAAAFVPGRRYAGAHRRGRPPARPGELFPRARTRSAGGRASLPTPGCGCAASTPASTSSTTPAATAWNMTSCCGRGPIRAASASPRPGARCAPGRRSRLADRPQLAGTRRAIDLSARQPEPAVRRLQRGRGRRAVVPAGAL